MPLVPVNMHKSLVKRLLQMILYMKALRNCMRDSLRPVNNAQETEQHQHIHSIRREANVYERSSLLFDVT